MKYIYKPLFAWKRLGICLFQQDIIYFLPTIKHHCHVNALALDMSITFLFWTINIYITKQFGDK